VEAALKESPLGQPRGRHRAPKASSSAVRRIGAVGLLTAPAWALGTATLTSHAIAAPASCSSVGQGARGEVVKAIQRTVGATPDGIYGPLTAGAVRAWQAARGLSATGTVDAATWARFPGAGAVVCTADSPTAGPASCPVLSQGARGTSVVLVQRRVGATPDGIFGPLTAAAVARTQSELSLPASGVVDFASFSAFGLVGTEACTVASAPVSAGPQDVAGQVSTLLSRPDGPVSGTAAQVIAFARSQIGVPYLTGGSTAAGYDCSGLVLASYGSAGIGLARVAAQQYLDGPNVSLTDLRPGDTVYYATNLADPNSIYHTAIYIGGGQMIEAAKPGTLVRQVPLRTADLFPTAARPASVIILPAANPSSGSTARAIQTRLVAYGYGIAIDGVFGPKTAAAVTAFQQAHGLPANGIVDAATWALLSS